MPLGAARLSFLSRAIIAAAGGSIAYRTDAYASSVFLALPFDETNELNDVSASINGSSTQATLTSGANSTVTNAEVYWSTPSYGKALENVATGGTQSMAYALSTSIPAASSGTYVIEGWFLADNATSNANWCISSGDSGGRFLFGINSSSSTNYAAENNIGLGDSNWHHVAIVNDAGSKRVYIDGKYKQATTGGNTDWYSTNTGFSTLHLGQFNAGDGNDYRGHIQDFKVTIGSNRGYTGTSTSSANFTLPGSIVATFASLASGGNISSYNDGTNTYIIHEFTSSGIFTPSEALTIDMLSVGGGGGAGGGSQNAGESTGGGGGGQVRTETGATTIALTDYTITIGDGGSGGGSQGNTGDTTSAFGYNATGGGGGGGVSGSTKYVGRNGGSAGGGGGATLKSGGTGTYAGQTGGSNNSYGGGGGGAGATSTTSGQGGDGAAITNFHEAGTVYFGGGGGGGSKTGGNRAGGSGGGGQGQTQVGGNPSGGSDGTANTGGGGGGKYAYNQSGQTGGSGIVIIRYTI